MSSLQEILNEKTFPAGILIDMYHTLVYEKGGYGNASVYVADFLGVPYREYQKARVRTYQAARRGAYPNALARAKAILANLHLNASDRYAELMVRLEIKCRIDNLEVYSDCERVLKELKNRRIKLALVSNATPEWRTIFEHSGISHLFDRLIFSFEIGAVKPDPPIYLHALEELKCLSSQCFFIGDGADQEIEGAHSVGLVSVLLSRQSPSSDQQTQQPHADYQISSLDEFLLLIDQ